MKMLTEKSQRVSVNLGQFQWAVIPLIEHVISVFYLKSIQAKFGKDLKNISSVIMQTS